MKKPTARARPQPRPAAQPAAMPKGEPSEIDVLRAQLAHAQQAVSRFQQANAETAALASAAAFKLAYMEMGPQAFMQMLMNSNGLTIAQPSAPARAPRKVVEGEEGESAPEGAAHAEAPAPEASSGLETVTAPS